MTDYRLLQSGTNKRLLENTNGYLLEGAFVGTVATARANIAGFRIIGPLPNIAAHCLIMSRMDKLSSVPSYPQVVYLFGGNGNEISWLVGGTPTNPAEAGDVARDCTDRGIHRRRMLTIPTDWTWGDDEMITRVDSMLTYAEANYKFNPPYHMIGVSMGTTCCLNWAHENLDRVKSIALMLTAADMQTAVDTGRFTPYYPNIIPPDDPQAYGVRPPDDHNPVDYAAEMTGVPIKMWQSNNDTICPLSEAQTFATGSGATLVNIGNQSGGFLPGHGLNTGFTTTQVQDFLIAND